ncbi:MAG: bifunctional hydroxymethylpyrimidine kinase/phosphomethylpyrimidine kinase [Candidatus Hydrogenedentes bacterium]|nr:bifunctional hydroxymethylpyrimidine kinase/phosphomethylpyrimidine kinase [Candidatus Hydrogenedentota bacterium]
MSDASIARALTIAGSDSGGGAGIQADLKTFAMLGVYGMSAITACTAQNTLGVESIHGLPADFVVRQIDLVVQDIGADAAKTGMLYNAEIVAAVAVAVSRNQLARLVVDPVMVSKSGASLLQEEARKVLAEKLLPLAYLVTPNVPEAEFLAGMSITNSDQAQEAAKKILALGPKHVLIKGGHLVTPEATDYLYDGRAFHPFAAPRIETRNSHGTGCTFSAAITAYLAKGNNIFYAIRSAKEYVTEAIKRGLPLGKGCGPLHHTWLLDRFPQV